MSFEKVFAAIDDGHRLDPNKLIDGTPYELHYAVKSSNYLAKHTPNASELLRIAVRAQHFRRFEIPRSTYPMTKLGYLRWRSFLKQRQGDMVAKLCIQAGYSEFEANRVAALIRKDDFKSDVEAQALEDVACLVFLDDQFEDFNKNHDEAKIIRILRKTWVKMSSRGHELALEMDIAEPCRSVVLRALSGESHASDDHLLE